MAETMHHTGYDGPWTWPDFTPKEIACRHCGELFLDRSSLDCLQRLRSAWGKPVRLTSAHRCAEHNRKVGGSPNSQHLKLAFDCACPAAEQDAFVALARRSGFTGVGRYPGRNFVHLDCGPERSWRG